MSPEAKNQEKGSPILPSAEKLFKQVGGGEDHQKPLW